MPRLLWFGVETSGLQEAPLEIALLTTDIFGGDPRDEYQSLVLPFEMFDGTLEIDPVVWHKHLDSGLLLEFEAVQQLTEGAAAMAAALERYATATIERELATKLHGEQYMLAGLNVLYDLEILMTRFPRIAALCNNSFHDISAMRNMLVAAEVIPAHEPTRAMEQVLTNLSIYQTFQE